MDKAEIRAKLLAEAEAAIDTMLAKSSTIESMTMRDIVGLALESGEQVEAAVVVALSQETAQAKLLCEQCGKPMHYKGRRVRDVVTSAGESRLKRDYYYCTHCKVGRFPPG